MDEQTILADITGIMRDYFDDDDLDITAATTAADIKAWDSLNHVNIVVAVEQHFHVKFLTSEVETLRNVGELVSLVSKRIK